MGWDNPAVPWRELRRRMAWRSGGEPPPEEPAADLPRPPAPAAPRGPVIPWAELHCHSSYSFLDGAATPGELVAEAARLGLETLAITDHDGMYGVPQFAQAAARLRDQGTRLRTVFGAELSLAEGVCGTVPKSRGVWGGSSARGNTATCWFWPGTPKATEGCARSSAPPSWRAGKRGIRSTTPARWPARTGATGWC